MRREVTRVGIEWWKVLVWSRAPLRREVARVGSAE